MKYYMVNKRGEVLTKKEAESISIIAKNDARILVPEPEGFNLMDFYYGVLSTNSKFNPEN